MTIQDWRDEIDKIDAELLRLLSLRARLAVRVGRVKRVEGVALTDRAREREVLARARASNPGPLDAEQVERIFRLIIRESRRVEARALKDSGVELEGAGR